MSFAVELCGSAATLENQPKIGSDIIV